MKKIEIILENDQISTNVVNLTDYEIVGLAKQLILEAEMRQVHRIDNLDSKRLDLLQSLTQGYGKGWVLRESIKGRGIRLHESSKEEATTNVREAIDNYAKTFKKNKNE